MPSVKLTAEPQKYRKGQKSRPPQDMPFDVAMRKFKKAVEAAGVLQELSVKNTMKSRHGSVSVRKQKLWPEQNVSSKLMIWDLMVVGECTNVSNG